MEESKGQLIIEETQEGDQVFYTVTNTKELLLPSKPDPIFRSQTKLARILIEQIQDNEFMIYVGIPLGYKKEVFNGSLENAKKFSYGLAIMLSIEWMEKLQETLDEIDKIF